MSGPKTYSYSRNNNGILIRNEDNALVPEDDPDNAAYLLYQKWIQAGNTPIPGFPQPPHPHVSVPPPEPGLPLPPDEEETR
jgi:hypothetical protein